MNDAAAWWAVACISTPHYSAFGWLAKNPADAAGAPDKMRALRKVGVPYSDEDIAGASKAVEGKTELDVLVAYLQGLGIELKGVK